MKRVLVAMAGMFALAAAPTASAAELQAAFDVHVPGKGFEIGLVNAATGTARPLPAGVNTADDELHPTLSPDGRTLTFTRMKLLPQLNGDITVPEQRQIVTVNLQTGAVSASSLGAGGVGPNYTQKVPGNVQLSWGAQPDGTSGSEGNIRAGMSIDGTVPTNLGGKIFIQLSTPTNVFFPHVASVRGGNPAGDLRYLTLAIISPVSGIAQGIQSRLSLTGTTLADISVGDATHPVPRVSDEFVAMDRFGDIATMAFPGQTTPTPAPAPITTALAERMPAWSPDGLQLGFVREDTSRRRLGVYDLTPGLQTIVNPLVDLGALAPTPQTRAFQNLWGGLSLAPIPDAPVVECKRPCVRQDLLLPTILKPVTGLNVGAFIVKRTGGTRTALGVKQPKIKVVGRFPLGAVKAGRNRFALPKGLKPGKYLLTYRLLRGDKITTVSESIPLTVKR